MANSGESQYKELLNPVKDPEKSFAINISELLQSFVSELIEGKSFANFNSAALLLQGSASIYGKKVEYLYDLAIQLHNSLLKQNKEDQQKQKKDPKEREKKEEKLKDPFLSIEIKIGKNLSCLRKKNTNKASTKKPAKKCKNITVPITLISADNENKGEVFYDTRGGIVGNRGDFAMNKCRLISSGWLLVPTFNPKLAPPVEAKKATEDSRNNNTDGTQTNIHSSPDEGLGSQSITSSNNTPQTNSTDPSQQSEAPSSVDEGIGSAPVDDICHSPGTEGIENVPADCGENGDMNQAPMPVRQSVRQALQTCQLALEDDPLAGDPLDKELLLRKKVQKRNTRSLPKKLKMAPGEEENVCVISDYCARTFFSIDGKALKNSLLSFDVDDCFDQNSKFLYRMVNKIASLKASDKRNKTVDPIEDEREIDVVGIECLKDVNEDDDCLHIPFEDNDIQIDNDPSIRIPAPTPPRDPSFHDDVPVSDLPSPDISHIAHEECEKYTKELAQFLQNSDISQRVQEWEKTIMPFLDEIETRESFDINTYGSDILNAFEDNNRKQTMTFRQFCRQKDQWKIHRYFMALLPLANIGNVLLDPEPRSDGTQEIFITLLSRKMHHKELEEFGHNDGSHS